MSFDYSKNCLFVDVSYLTFFRFFALKRWFSFANKEVDTSSENFKWLENDIFLEKYKKTLFDTITSIAKSRKCKVPFTNIVFALDCRHKDIWRLKFCNNKSNNLCPEYNINYSYKGDRKATLKKQRFEEYEVFDLVKNTLLPEFINKHKNVLLSHKNAEADDCVALGIKHLQNNKNYNKQIWIIASDFDYMQICDSQVHLMDLKKKQLDIVHLNDANLSNEQYLIKKILLGDKSDNIYPCRFKLDLIGDLNSTHDLRLRKNKEGHYNVTPKVFEKLKNNQLLWDQILTYFNKNKSVLKQNKKQKSDTIFLDQNILDMNQRLIDFDLIPNNIKIKFESS